ncbi:hypothetical protein K501DRAFT_255463 [Backusella circina FSU 941]|nr:hypothetical protein K501DRAFT_255463 [Backusella circina FSU 941]
MNEEDYEDNDEEEEEEEEEEMEDEEMEEEIEMEEDENTKLSSSSTSKKRKLGNIPNGISTPINPASTVTTAANSQVATPDTPSFKDLSSAVPTDFPGFSTAQGVFAQPPLPVHNPGHQPIVYVRDIEAERPQVGSRQRKNEFEPYANGDMLNISQYTARHVDYPKRPAKKQKMEVDNALDIPSLIKPTPCDYEDMPLPAWYDEDIISEYEKLGLPEFFDESNQDLGPHDYKLCRDYMIEKYKANPDYYLTISACKAHLEHDLVVLVRIHSFLEHSGLINSRTDPRRRIFDPFIDSEPDSLILSESQRDFKDIEHADLEFLRKLIFDPSNVKSSRSNWSILVEDNIKADGRKIFNCYNCNTDCSQFRYQSLKSKDTNICIDCFLEGRFPATTYSGDYIRMDAGPELFELDEEWTDAEILKLLEGVDKYDDDWLLISELVSTRSKEQCITKFLQLPINDEFLTAKLSRSEKERLPFSDTPNPVMTMTSFLAGHINPGIGAAAAKEALKVLLQSGEGKDQEMKEEEDVQVKVEKMEEDDDTMGVDDEEPKKAPGAFSEDTMTKATKAALKSGIESTLKLAGYEDQEIQHWTRLAVQTIVDKLVLKVQQYDELESSLENELKELEKQQGLLATSIESLSKQHFPLPSATDVVATTTEVTATPPTASSTNALNTVPPTLAPMGVSMVGNTGVPAISPALGSMPVLAPAPLLAPTPPSSSTPPIAPAPPANEPDTSQS